MHDKPLRLAIVGCGTVSEGFHAPALRKFSGFSPTIMVDLDPARTGLMSRLCPGSTAESDFRKIFNRVDAAIVALPNHLNAPVAGELLDAGISVLVEKPIAMTAASAQVLQDKAARAPAKLSVGFMRREAVGIRMARACIANGTLGDIVGFSIEDGFPFAWQAVNEFRFDKARGGGILMDIGSHVLDTLRFWFGDITIARYADDSRGGVETNCVIDVATPGGASGTVELSWTRNLRNSARIVGTHATLDVEWYANNARLSVKDGAWSLAGPIAAAPGLGDGAETFPSLFESQLKRWHATLNGDTVRGAGIASGIDGLRNIELIAACRAAREDLAEPWRIVHPCQ